MTIIYLINHSTSKLFNEVYNGVMALFHEIEIDGKRQSLHL
jgi:hypothetical protein